MIEHPLVQVIEVRPLFCMHAIMGTHSSLFELNHDHFNEVWRIGECYTSLQNRNSGLCADAPQPVVSAAKNHLSRPFTSGFPEYIIELMPTYRRTWKLDIIMGTGAY